MSDVQLFRISNGRASEIRGTSINLEKALQSLMEANLETLLGIRFLATEYSTGKTHAGRIDTLGLDENNCPVIVEYKRASHENIINQGLFYMDWLMDHKAEFKLLVLEKYGAEFANTIDWSAPRLLCIAADFTRYDAHAVQQIGRNIELIRYRQFGPELLLLELTNAVSTQKALAGGNVEEGSARRAPNGNKSTDKTVEEWLVELPEEIKNVFDALNDYIQTLGDDIQRNDLKLYVAFKRLRNFATVEFSQKKLLLCLRLNPDDYEEIPGFARDVRNIGHWGTGDLQLAVKDLADLERAKPYILAAYEGIAPKS